MNTVCETYFFQKSRQLCSPGWTPGRSLEWSCPVSVVTSGGVSGWMQRLSATRSELSLSDLIWRTKQVAKEKAWLLAPQAIFTYLAFYSIQKVRWLSDSLPKWEETLNTRVSNLRTCWTTLASKLVWHHYSHSVAKVTCLQDMSCNCHQGGWGEEGTEYYDSWQTPQLLRIYWWNVPKTQKY